MLKRNDRMSSDVVCSATIDYIRVDWFIMYAFFLLTIVLLLHHQRQQKQSTLKVTEYSKPQNYTLSHRLPSCCLLRSVWSWNIYCIVLLSVVHFTSASIIYQLQLFIPLPFLKFQGKVFIRNVVLFKCVSVFVRIVWVFVRTLTRLHRSTQGTQGLLQRFFFHKTCKFQHAVIQNAKILSISYVV